MKAQLDTIITQIKDINSKKVQWQNEEWLLKSVAKEDTRTYVFLEGSGVSTKNVVVGLLDLIDDNKNEHIFYELQIIDHTLNQVSEPYRSFSVHQYDEDYGAMLIL